MEKVHIGTTIKVGVYAKGTPNVKLTDMEYNVFVWAGDKNDEYSVKPNTGIITRSKTDLIEIDSENALVEVPTALIGKGYVIVRIEAQVPDTDCAGGWRKEIEQYCPDILIVD